MIGSIETTGNSCAVALVDEGKLLLELRSHIPRSHDRLLATLFRQLLEHAEIGPDDLKGLAVSVGPGSFTGIRIGISFAIGLATALDIPVIPVSTLDAIAWRGRSIGEVSGRNRLLALVPDRKDGVFAALYEINPTFHRLTAPYDISIKELIPMLDENVIAAGPGAAVLAHDYCDCVPESFLTLTAEAVGLYGYELFRKGIIGRPDQIQPLYVGGMAMKKPQTA